MNAMTGELRERLMKNLEALEDKTIDVDRAAGITKTADVILKSYKVDLEYEKFENNPHFNRGISR